MAQKKTESVDSTPNLKVKRPLTHKGFYTLLLTALLGMFIFVTYYASQQTQVYRSRAATCTFKGQACSSAGQCCTGVCSGGKCACRPNGASCNGAGIYCCSNTCTNGTCGGGGGPPPPPPGGQTHKGCSGTTCMMLPGPGTDQCSNANPPTHNAPQCMHKGCSGTTCMMLPGPGTDTCSNAVPPTDPAPQCVTSCSMLTTQARCALIAKCSWDSTTNTCVASGIISPSVSPTLTPTPTPAACINYTDPASCASAGCGWNSDLGCCGGEPPCVAPPPPPPPPGGPPPPPPPPPGGGGSPTPTTGPGTPTPTTGGGGGTGTARFNLSLAFQGITQAPLSGQNTMDVLVTLSGGGLAQNIPAIGTFTTNGGGIWTGGVSFSGLSAGGGYKLLVKGPKHVQKKICDSAPTETAPGTYRCGDGDITVSTSSTNTFDLSGAKLLVGDLSPQDGIIDAYDISLVRNNFCTTANPDVCKDPKLLSEADLNLDGIIDSQDYSLLISSLSVKYDEN